MASFPRPIVSFVLLFLFLILSGPAHAKGVQWLSYEEAVNRSRTEKKLVYLFFYSERCPWCVRMDEDVLAKTGVGAFLDKHFLSARVHVEKDAEVADLFRVRGLPTHIFLSEKAEEILLVRPGFIPEGSFLRMLQFMQAEKEKHDSAK